MLNEGSQAQKDKSCVFSYTKYFRGRIIPCLQLLVSGLHVQELWAGQGVWNRAADTGTRMGDLRLEFDFQRPQLLAVPTLEDQTSFSGLWAHLNSWAHNWTYTHLQVIKNKAISFQEDQTNQTNTCSVLSNNAVFRVPLRTQILAESSRKLLFYKILLPSQGRKHTKV